MKIGIYDFDSKVSKDLGFDSIDVLILEWFIRFINSGNMVTKEIDGDEYYWIKYDALINDLYLTGVNTKESIHKRLKR